MDKNNLLDRINESCSYIKSKTRNMDIYAAIVLGSGLGSMADEIQNPIYIDYKDIPNFPVSTVPGHKGRFVIGKLEGKNVICMQGRFHYYEGWTMQQVVFPIQVMKVLGVKKLILTNAAGCVNTSWNAGDLMLITDHIKITTSETPMRGQNCDELGLRFFDSAACYDKESMAIAEKCANELGVTLRKGVYMFFAGPQFESPAEVRAARILGADAVGMSTVPEIIAASHCNLKTIGISCLTNMASGILDQPLSHSEVLETGLKVSKSFSALVKSIVRNF